MPDLRPIALYLPQFHPIPENDEWWGKGFTEWKNVVEAKPRFKGHHQPHLPSDLGYYDLRLSETREAQADLAMKYGIYGFCYYHYWFNGKRLLEKPFEEVFISGKPDFPFMLCWANENWTRAWDGGEDQVLIKQDYRTEDDIRHINSLIPYFNDKRYIRVDDKPVFIIYKDGLFPDVKETIRVFREEAAKHGMELYLCRFERERHTLPYNPESLGFDAAIEFQPLSLSKRKYISEVKDIWYRKYFNINRYIDFIYLRVFGKTPVTNSIIDYKSFIEYDLRQKDPEYKFFPCVSPGWDNSPRRKKVKALIFKNSSPELFKQWITGKIKKFKPYSHEENFLFINAWNEWAEGNHLEPCEKWGHEYLKAFSEAMKQE